MRTGIRGKLRSSHRNDICVALRLALPRNSAQEGDATRRSRSHAASERVAPSRAAAIRC